MRRWGCLSHFAQHGSCDVRVCLLVDKGDRLEHAFCLGITLEELLMEYFIDLLKQAGREEVQRLVLASRFEVVLIPEL